MKPVPRFQDPCSHEQHFMAEIDALVFGDRDLRIILARLDGWLASLSAGLAAATLAPAGWEEGSALARRAEAVTAALGACMSAWPRQWEALKPAHALAESLDDKAVLLVFGKFNAGKSSFCNFIADRFAAQGRAVGYFHLHAGCRVETPERFTEGATETTARLQGVRLGNGLVLLDTPGLHSTTPENAALTRRFTDSADGVLWLTSSAAPGQVQELDELAQELRRAKPLLPVVTRSDFYEEDEIDGALVKRLRNKTAPNRAQQEADVAARARDKLAAMGVDVALLQEPVSISVHMARGQGPAAMTEAGLERLHRALRALVGPALAYKRRKPAEVLLRHLDETVLGGLRHHVLPLVAELKASVDCARAQLEGQHAQVRDDVWRATIPRLAGLLEAHAAARDVGAVCHGLSQFLRSAFERAAREHLSGYRFDPDVSCAAIAVGEDIGFEELVIEVEGHRHSVGIDYARLHAVLEREVRDWVLRAASAMAERCSARIGALAQGTAHLEAVLDTHEKALLDLKAEVRAGAVRRSDSHHSSSRRPDGDRITSIG